MLVLKVLLPVSDARLVRPFSQRNRAIRRAARVHEVPAVIGCGALFALPKRGPGEPRGTFRPRSCCQMFFGWNTPLNPGSLPYEKAPNPNKDYDDFY